jgi:hypothetical protein
MARQAGVKLQIVRLRCCNRRETVTTCVQLSSSAAPSSSVQGRSRETTTDLFAAQPCAALPATPVRPAKAAAQAPTSPAESRLRPHQTPKTSHGHHYTPPQPTKASTKPLSMLALSRPASTLLQPSPFASTARRPSPPTVALFTHNLSQKHMLEAAPSGGHSKDLHHAGC